MECHQLDYLTRPKKSSWATNYDDGDGDNDDDVVRVSNPETSGLGNLTKNHGSDENERMSDPPIKELHNHKANKSTSTWSLLDVLGQSETQ